MLATTGCGTTPSTETANAGLSGLAATAPAAGSAKETDAAKARYVLCSEVPPITYNAPDEGQQDDRANAYDTPETVGDPKTRGTIRYFNTTVIAACSPMYDRYKRPVTK